MLTFIGGLYSVGFINFIELLLVSWDREQQKALGPE
jgi:hypothetical protein